MKRICLLLTLLLLLTACAKAAPAQTTEPETWTEGICLVAKDGPVLIVVDGGPIVMTDSSETGGLFEGLATGDRIRVVCGPIMESYPAQTQIYKLEKIGSGSINDIPEQTLEQLREMGWLD